MNKIIIFLATILAFFATGCGETEKASMASMHVNVEGTWASEMNNGTQMVAKIRDNKITIKMEDEDITAIYWKGTFPQVVKNGNVIVSKANRHVLDRSLLGSQDKTKPFNYEDGELSFEMSMMGVTKKVELTRA